MSNSGEVNFLTEEIEDIIDKLKPGQIQIIERSPKYSEIHFA